MPTLIKTRYSGTWEGGPWAAFDIESEDELPEDAFAGDIFAAEWWMSGRPSLWALGTMKRAR